MLEKNHPESYTLKVNGKAVVCAGVIEHWPGRGEAWAVLDKECSKYFRIVHKTVLMYLDMAPFERIEATVIGTFDKGHRWAESLGFVCEAPTMRKYGVTGIDYALYAKVRD